jgi:hypothetical protein
MDIEINSTRHASGAIVGCLLLLVAIKLGLRIGGFRRTLAFLQRRSIKSHRLLGATVSVDNIANRVAVASAFFPGRARCLEQSLLLYVLLRRHGASATIRLGIQPHRRRAHAWVEVDGHPVNERSELLRKLIVFPVVK